MARFLDRLGRTAARRHWWFIGAWLLAAVGAVFLAVSLDGQTNDNFTIPDTQSQQALDLLEADFPQMAGATATVVFNAPQGFDDPTVQAAIQSSISARSTNCHMSTPSAR